MNRDERVYKVSPKLKFTLSEEHLIEEGWRGIRRWRQAWPLQQLSPELESVSGRPQGTRQLNAKAPLIAPLILIIGLILQTPWPTLCEIFAGRAATVERAIDERAAWRS